MNILSPTHNFGFVTNIGIVVNKNKPYILQYVMENIKTLVCSALTDIMIWVRNGENWLFLINGRKTYRPSPFIFSKITKYLFQGWIFCNRWKLLGWWLIYYFHWWKMSYIRISAITIFTTDACCYDTVVRGLPPLQDCALPFSISYIPPPVIFWQNCSQN